jgi:DNA-binding MarR family transcriptional regulator
MKPKDVMEISDTLLHIAFRVDNIKREIRNFGTGHMLHGAEIGTIVAIRENRGISVTDLAARMNVTKGAVSQILKRLLKKGMIVKKVDAENLSRLKLGLTRSGEIAYENHAKRHRDMENGIRMILKDASDENISFLKDFLTNTMKVVAAYHETVTGSPSLKSKKAR